MNSCRLLAERHRKLANEAMLDVVQRYHADLAQRLADEAALIPRRTAILERLMNANNKNEGFVDIANPGRTRITFGVMRALNPWPRSGV
jgi:hypothetical protein